MSFVRLRLAIPALLIVGCSHEITSPEPGVSAVAPDLVCNGPSVSRMDGITNVVLTGSDFTPMPSRTLTDPRRLLLPKVTLGPVDALPGGSLPAQPTVIADDPTNPGSSRVHWTSETSMSFDVAPVDMLPTGVFDVTVTNPDGSHAATLAQHLAVLPPPVVTSAAPMAICDDQSDQTIVVTGTDLLVYDGATPTVTIATAAGPKTYPTTFDAADCQAVPGTYTEHSVELCTKVTFVIPQGDIAVTTNTMVELTVTNPAPADCASATGIQVTLDAPPHVDSVVPSTVCQGGAQLTINGSNFLPGATVELVCGSVTVTAANVTINADGTQISATFGGGATVGQCDVIVQNPDGCQDRPLPHKTINVTPGPVAFYVDPSVVYNGINTVITVYATTLTYPVTVTITMGATSTQLTTLPKDNNHPNRVQAIVPKNQAPGTYDLILADALNCPTTLPNALTVTNTTTVTLKNVVPPFGQTGTDTAVEVFRDTTAMAPNDHPFVATPRVFLNPHNGTPTDVAVPLESVAFLDQDRVTGIVPAATPAHVYDVVLVNPDGTVGVLDSGYTETTTAPPEIDSATPSSIVDATGQSVVLSGKAFATGDTITLSCVDAAGNAETPPAIGTSSPSCTAGACTQTVPINGSGLTVGSICIVRLTNPDGTYGEYSAIGVTNSSKNLISPKAGMDMNVGRRALSGAAGNATATDRFVYAIGGDSGTAAGALDSVEFAQVDIYGAIGAWTIEPPALRAKRTLAGAVTAGRYIYLAGGNDGAGAVATAERALILSPREAPEVTDVDLQLQATGLDPGTYHYRVSAVFSATDPDNPGGESLASDEFTIRVPSFPGKKVVLTLVFKAPVDSLGATLPNIVGYKIYRTAVDGAGGTEVLYAQTMTTATSFVDDGSGTLGTAVPLPLGSTGNWAALPVMSKAREGLGLAWARDPVTPSTLYVYALLGRQSMTAADPSYEYLTVTTAPNGRQTAAAAWTTGTLTSSQGRWQLGAWTVDGTVSSSYAAPPVTYVFAGGGQTAGGMMANKVEAGLVTAGGQLATTSATAPTVLDDTPKDFASPEAGYGVCAANDQLFAFGGLNSLPTNGAQSAQLTSTPPGLTAASWNNEGITLTHGRYLMGSAVQSAFIFLLGGQTDEPSMASKTTELVIW